MGLWISEGKEENEMTKVPLVASGCKNQKINTIMFNHFKRRKKPEHSVLEKSYITKRRSTGKSLQKEVSLLSDNV